MVYLYVDKIAIFFVCIISRFYVAGIYKYLFLVEKNFRKHSGNVLFSNIIILTDFLEKSDTQYIDYDDLEVNVKVDFNTYYTQLNFYFAFIFKMFL